MSQPADREGSFRGRIVEYGLKEFETGAVAISARAELDEFFDGENWISWSEYAMEASGNLFIIKKDGTTNKTQVESLCRNAGWDGSIGSIDSKTWEPTPCQFALKENTYNNSTTFQIAFVNAFESTPGGSLSNVNANRVKELETKYGGSLRAIVGGLKQATPAPATAKPKAPSRPNGEKKKETAVVSGDGSNTDKDIPF